MTAPTAEGEVAGRDVVVVLDGAVVDDAGTDDVVVAELEKWDFSATALTTASTATATITTWR